MRKIEEDTHQGRMLSKAFGISVQGDCHFRIFITTFIPWNRPPPRAANERFF